MTIQDDSGTHVTLAGSEESSDQQALPRGSNLGRYVIIEPIGSGGMGTVYRAYDPQLNRGVALKILSVKQADIGAAERAKARLIREAQALAQLSHPNVVAVHDAGTFEDDVFIAMELIEGKTLDEWMRQEKRSIKETLEVTIAAGRGLSAAHNAGLVHRDFKPGNVIVGDDGRVRVLDFGLARAADQTEVLEEGSNVSKSDEQSRAHMNPDNWKEISSDSSSNLLQSPLTQAGGVVGTPMYMAPEQYLGLKTDERTDQFGFCVVLYEALYGRRPFSGLSVEELKDKVIRQQVLVPKTDTDVPAWLWQIVHRGLSSKPNDRYPNIDLLLDELTKDPEETCRQKRLAHRRWLFVITLILLVTALPVGVWFGLRYRTFQLCTNVEGDFQGVWDETTRAEVRKAFLGTGRSFALGTWERVEKKIDRDLAEWTQMRSDVCRAKLIRATLSEELFDLRMNCLRKRRRELAALIRVFAKADAEVVQKAVRASTSLTSIDFCADDEALKAPYPPPRTAAAKKKVADIREALAEVEAFHQTGKYREGLDLAKRLEKKAKAVGYLPAQAEVLFRLGKLIYNTGDYKKTETTLYDAALIAGKSGDIRLVAETLSFLLFVVGYAQGRPGDGLLIGKDAEFVVELVGNDDALRSRFYNNMGSIFLRQADYDNALICYNKALQSWEKIVGSEHINLAMPLNNIGAAFFAKGEAGKALEYHRRALEIRKKVLGPEHPEVAMSLNNIGDALQKQKKYEKSLESYRRALAVYKNALGFDHPVVAWSLNGIGTVLLRQGKAKQALDSFERLVQLCEKKNCDYDPNGQGYFGLARSLTLTGGDRTRAIELANHARETFEKTPKAFKKDLKEVNTWLQKHGENKLAKKAHK